MVVRIVSVVAAAVFSSALAWGQAQIPDQHVNNGIPKKLPEVPRWQIQTRGLPDSVHWTRGLPTSGLPYVKGDMKGYPGIFLESCATDSVNAKMEVTTQMLKMILDDKGYGALVTSEQGKDPAAVVQSRVNLIGQFISEWKKDARH